MHKASQILSVGDGSTGRTGDNSFIRVPVGTMVSEVLPDEVKQALNVCSTIYLLRLSVF